MIIVGIDPGQQGALAMIDTKKKKEWIIDMPLLPEKDIDAKELFQMFQGIKHSSGLYVVIEKAQSMPGQSSVAMFNYGGGYHTILAVLRILDIPFEEVRSNKWKVEFGLSGLKLKKDKSVKLTKEEKNAAKKQRKEMAVKIAMQMFPKLKHEFATERGKLLDGRAEALLIAEWARRKVDKK